MSTAAKTNTHHQGIEAAATGRVTRVTQKDNITFVGMACNRAVRDDRSESGWSDKTTFTTAKLVGDAHKNFNAAEVKQGTLIKAEGPLDSREYADKAGQKRTAIDMTIFKPENLTVISQPKTQAEKAAAQKVAAQAASDEPPF